MAMNPAMRMMMLDRMRTDNNRYRSEYGGDSDRRMIGYDREPVESRRRRDSRGRFMEGDGWEDNRDYSRNVYEPEARRRRDSRGRYMMDDDDDETEMRGQTWYPPSNRMPPNMNGSRYGFGDVYAHINAPGAMNRPGGMMGGDMSQPVDEKTARRWVRDMDGGEHFDMQTAMQHRSICPECDPYEWYVALNAMYSDHCETAKKYGMDKPDFYASLAKDFLMDKDAGPHKLRKYMETIPKH